MAREKRGFGDNLSEWVSTNVLTRVSFEIICYQRGFNREYQGAGIVGAGIALALGPCGDLTCGSMAASSNSETSESEKLGLCLVPGLQNKVGAVGDATSAD